MVDLVCPRCRAPITRVGTSLSCAACGVDYAIVDGIPDLLGPDVVGGEEAPETDYYSPMRKRVDPLGVFVADSVFAAVREVVAGAEAALGRQVDIVDIGSGNLLRPPAAEPNGPAIGRLMAIIRDHARSYVGLEPSWAMLRDVEVEDGRVAHLPLASLVRTTGEDLPLAPASADVVLCLAVLDHCVDPALVLRRARETLRPGGVFVLTLQNHDRWYRQVLRALAPEIDRRHEARDHHHHHFTPSTARALVAAEGFRETELHEFGYLLVPRVRDFVGAALRPVERLGRQRAARAVAMLDRSLSRAVPGGGQAFLLSASR